jgi:hypothetical protein
MDQQLSIIAAFKEAFKLFTSSFKLLLPILLISFVVNAFVQVLGVTTPGQPFSNYIPAFIIDFFYGPFIAGFYIIGFHSQYHRRNITLTEIFYKIVNRLSSLLIMHVINLTIIFLASAICYYSMSYPGHISFPIIISIVCVVLYYFLNTLISSILVVIEKNDAVESIKKSWEILEPYRMRTFGLIIVFAIIGALISMLSNSFFQKEGRFILSTIDWYFMSALIIVWYEQLKKATILTQNENPADKGKKTYLSHWEQDEISDS